MGGFRGKESGDCLLREDLECFEVKKVGCLRQGVWSVFIKFCRRYFSCGQLLEFVLRSLLF